MLNKIISELKIQFQQRFSDLDIKSEKINTFQNPFSCNIEKLHPTLQIETIDLQCNDTLKIKYHNMQIKKKSAIEYISATIYLCEPTFSKSKYIKSKYRSTMFNKHLE